MNLREQPPGTPEEPKGDILMVEVLFPPVTRRARNKNKSEMNRCLPIWLSRPTSHQPTPTLSREGRGSQKSLRPSVLSMIQRYWGQGVEQNFQRVIRNSTNDTIGILSPEGNGHGNPTWRHEHAKKSAKRSQLESAINCL